jgi:hypothetical protein
MPDQPQVSDRSNGLPGGAAGKSAGRSRNRRWSAALAVLACLVCVLGVSGVFVLKSAGLLNPAPVEPRPRALSAPGSVSAASTPPRTAFGAIEGYAGPASSLYV